MLRPPLIRAPLIKELYTRDPFLACPLFLHKLQGVQFGQVAKKHRSLHGETKLSTCSSVRKAISWVGPRQWFAMFDEERKQQDWWIGPPLRIASIRGAMVDFIQCKRGEDLAGSLLLPFQNFNTSAFISFLSPLHGPASESP